MKHKIVMLTLAVLAALAFAFLYPRNTLEQNSRELEVMYINWACDCADYIELSHFNDPDYEIDDKDCLFIEAESQDLQDIEDSYKKDPFDKYLKLYGQFYTRPAVSKTYEQKTEECPGKAKVFRYTHIEIIYGK
ncbi:hypothetical protein Dip518_001077 [Parelusimicrobium proximum]|uniref:hypothetical protein n=1 Tax=Parelusimicrobium proximum TaxID=3228953 RepID=UPI003D17C245